MLSARLSFVSIFRYIVQGFGWEVGSQVAKEGLDTLRERADADEKAKPTEREVAKAAKERAKQEAAAAREREAIIARKKAEIEAQLVELKKKAQ